MDLTGIMTAIVTPLTEAYAVDEQKLRRLIDFQLAAGVSGILVLGGTGEYAALTMDVREQAVAATVKAVAGRVPVVAGVLEPGLGEAVVFARRAVAAGADALLVVTPYYVHPEQFGIARWYTRFDAAVNAPFLIYNIPYRTMVNILPETVAELADSLPNLIGMKECSPDLGQAIGLIRAAGDKITLLSGEEFLCTSELLLGMEGGVMATANLVPEVWVEIYRLAAAGDSTGATAILKRYYPLFKLLFSEVNPGPLKYALGLRGLDCGPAALPLGPPSDCLKEQIKAELGGLGLLQTGRN